MNYFEYILHPSYSKVWHHGSGRLIEEVPFPVPDHQGEFLYCARFWDSNTILAGGSGSNDIKIIERNSKKVSSLH